MSETRVQFNTIVSNQLPLYVREDFPLISDFLKQYYLGQEYQGGPVDLIQNIDRYIKIDNTTGLSESVVLSGDLDFDSTIINVDVDKSPTGTLGFPDSYGLLQINDEVVTYTGKTQFSFTGCVRGFVGITSYRSDTNKEEVVFKETLAEDHLSGSDIKNLSCLFLKEFLLKTKHQILPGFEDRELSSNLDQNLFLKQSKDFYLSKGTDRSFEILFKSLYNENVQIIRPAESLVTPSDAQYRVTNDLVVEPISGDPSDLDHSTLYQDAYKFDSNIQKSYAPITTVEKINAGYGVTFYRLKYDGGYDRDIEEDGSIYGTFKVHPSTKIIGNVSAGSTIVDVESTVGFAHSGELFVNYFDRTTGIVSYTSKSPTQFFGISDLDNDILDTAVVGINTFAYGYSAVDGSLIQVRINSVLNSIEIPEVSDELEKGTTANITNYGFTEVSPKTRNWFYNVSPVYKVSSIELIDASDNTYKITLNVPNQFRSGDKCAIIGSDSSRKDSTIATIIGEKSFTVRGQGVLDTGLTYKLQRTILKGLSSVFPSVESFSTDVDRVYKNTANNYLVSSPSIPNYGSQSLDSTFRDKTFSGTFLGDEFEITNHGFYTGESIYYKANSVSQSATDAAGNIITEIVRGQGLFSDGLYFIKRISESKVKFAKSREDIYKSKFISLDSEVTVTDSSIRPFSFNDKTVKPQNILREISTPISDGSRSETKPGATGIFVNGVELLNYKSSDSIKYGKIESIDVLSKGSNVDVVNPPDFLIKDAVGYGASAHLAVSGRFIDIKIVNPGFDYVETPTLKIEGGNGQGAIGSVNMKSIDHVAEFYADEQSNQVDILQSTIGFSTYHKFRNAEKVIYRTKSQDAVSGIVTDSSYFVNVVDEFTVKLHETESQALTGINTVPLTSYGAGKHSLQSFSKKLVVQSVNVTDSGSGYENKKRTAQAATGVSTASNSFSILNHDYSSGERIKYTCTNTPASGISVGSEYILTKIDNNSFKLSEVGPSEDINFFYRNKQYVDITSVGVGTHIFNYPDITATLIGKVGISSIGTETFKASILPIVRGTVQSVHVENSGFNYGSEEILNFDRQPQILLDSGSNAQLKAIVSAGSIQEVIVLNSGSGYYSTPDLIINGEGSGAVLTPIIENGSLVSVTVIEKGIGFDEDSTTIDVIPSGSTTNTPKFKCNIQNWTVNLFGKYENIFTDDDGFLTEGLHKNEIQYTHIYAPRKLREKVYSLNQVGEILYGKQDLIKVNGIESDSNYHSPILGFAYDGNPIYGPYAYSTKTGGFITQMLSGYSLNIQNSRPSTSIYPEGFFVEDYVYKNSSSDSVLDENNGRFCITPDYPNGTYAYFTTIDERFPETFGVFKNYKKPSFPYVIGHSYHSIPNNFNFVNSSNSNDYDLEANGWRRNTSPINLIEDESQYPYLNVPNKLNQTAEIVGTNPGVAGGVGIITGGTGYKVGESIAFDNTNTGGTGAHAKISRVKGKTVSSISVDSIILENVEFYPGQKDGEYFAFASDPHGIENLDVVSISGLSTTSSYLEGSYTAGISTNRLTLAGVGSIAVAIGTDGSTGLTTYFSVTGNLGYPHIRENDILQSGTEKFKVLNIDPESSRIRVLRKVSGSIGTTLSVGDHFYEIPRKLKISSGFKTDSNLKFNKKIYFNPADSIGIGTISGIGVGVTLTLSNPGFGATQLFVPTKSIFIKNHNLETGDQLTYSAGDGGSGIVVQDETNVGVGSTLADGQKLFVAKIDNNLIGLSTVRVGLGTTGTFVGVAETHRNSTTLFFTNIGDGDTHSFVTNYSAITGEIQRNLVTVSTTQTHGLSPDHNVIVSVSPENTKNIKLTYNDTNRRIIVNPVGFVTAGVSTSTNSITISSHGFETGDKIIHTSDYPSEGLKSGKVYYVVKVDRNTIKLSNTLTDSKKIDPVIIGISSASYGTINPINPKINLYKNSTVVFDLSDDSLAYVRQGSVYSAFEFNLYEDANFTSVWNTSQSSEVFEFSKSGKVGTSGASATLLVNNEIPENLYYRLDPIYEGNVPAVKSEIISDDEVVSGSKLIIGNSKYNGNHDISINSTNSFTYTISDAPEEVSYGSTANISYITDCTHTSGEIAEIDVINPGRNYYSTPGISNINTSNGEGAILRVNPKNIGGLKKLNFKDIGFNYPSDKTLNPRVLLPQTIRIDSLASIESIGITSFGRGFNIPPKLIVVDGKTNKVVEDLAFKVTLGNGDVEILQNTNGISNVNPLVIPTESGAGVGIRTITYDSSGIATATLSVGFSTVNSFPFAVGDKVLIESTSVGVGSTGKGFNSANYEYNLFTLTGVTENLGGIGDVTFDMSDFLTGSEIPGNYDTINSAGKILAQKHFPIFETNLVTRDYSIGEIVKSENATGIVEGWDPKTLSLRVSSDDNFTVGSIIEGTSSKVLGVANSIKAYETYANFGAMSKTTLGWLDDKGSLNSDLQRIQDSYYYQNFAYSIKSKVPYDTWNETVSTLNHTLGFKKFADLQMESSNDNNGSVKPNTSSFDQVTNLDGFASLHCVHDFDLVTETNRTQTSGLISNEIVFSNRILIDFLESIGNRVLSIDNFQSQFNSNPRPTEFSIIDTFESSAIRTRKFVTYVRDKRFTAQRQLMLVNVMHDGIFGYINQYARVETAYDQGSFDLSFSSGTEDANLQFYPTKFAVNDYNVSILSYDFKDALLGTGTTSLGGVAIIDTTSVNVNAGTNATIVSIANTYTSVKVLVSITADTSITSGLDNNFEYQELNILHNGSDINMLEIARMSTEIKNSSPGFGTYHPYFVGDNLNIDFYPATEIGTTGVINTVFVGLATETSSGTGTIELTRAKIEAKTTNIFASSSPGITTVAQYSKDYDGAYFIAQVADTTNNEYQLSELVVVDDYVDSTTTADTCYVEYGNIETSSGLGTFGTIVSDEGIVSLVFTPNANIDAKINVYTNALGLIEDDTVPSGIDFTNTSINCMVGDYEGTERDIKRKFYLEHENLGIFERYFEGNNPNVVNTLQNLISIPNHYFVTGEKIRYTNVGIANSSIVIAPTSFVGASNTTYLPEENLYVVKYDDNNIQIATSAENALKAIPEVVDITSVGIGTSHRFVSTNQNAKLLVSIDNIIQSPIVSTALTTTLSKQLTILDDVIFFSGITSFFGSDLIKINDEIMKIEGVGIGSTNAIRVRRGWLGTNLGVGVTGDLITKIVGNYNIVDNDIIFSEAPFGNVPLSLETNEPDERDWTGISTSSSFHGRSFMRSGILQGTNESYYKNYVFDDISGEFNALNDEFTLKSNGSNISGIENENAIILVNDVFQAPGISDQYVLEESAGITSVRFQGTEITPLGPDVGVSDFPRGGVIVSVGSTEGFGYQPLVAAGGTATVSSAGTITAVSIGNSGSGYRSGIQTNLSVGVQLPDTTGTTIIPIGIASISEGHVTSVAITTDRVFYAPRDISNVLYDNITGITTVTTSTVHGLSGNEEVIVSGIAFTCDYTGSGPVNISNVEYNNVTGIMVVTTSDPHNLSTSGQKSDVLLTGIGMTCDLDNGGSTHVYPRTTDPAYCGTPVLAVNSATEFEVNVGTSTVATYYQSGGVAQPVLIAPRISNNSASGFDPASQGSTVLKVIDSTNFEINTGISTRAHFYARCGTVSKPIDIVFEEPTSYSNMRLSYSSSSVAGLGTEATIDVVVGQGSSVIDFEIKNTGYAYGNGEILTVEVGGTTGIPTTSSYKEFQVTIDEVATDKFSGWSLGDLEVLDNIDEYIDGERKDFPLFLNTERISIVAAKGSRINVQDVLLVFVNDILQVPGESYTFKGGSVITFAEPIAVGNNINILFYKGTGDSDVVLKNVVETVKKGDTLQIVHDKSIDQQKYLTEETRDVQDILSTDLVETNAYDGPGVTNDVTLERPVVWCRQTEDKFINQTAVGKDRELYEPTINPFSYIIKPVGIGSTTIYVDSLRPLFDGRNESDTDLSFQNKVKFISQKVRTGAAATAIVSGIGTISSIPISDGGSGYSSAPEVTIGNVVGTGAVATAVLTNGSVTSISLTNAGTGYTNTNPPQVLIAPPPHSEEEVTVDSYSGDNGIVVGVGTTTIDNTNEIIVDLHIPYDSFLRDTSLVGTAVTLSSISVNDYFTIFNSNVGMGSTAPPFYTYTTDGSATQVGFATQFIDTIYQAKRVEVVSRDVAGVSTNVLRVNSVLTGIGTINFGVDGIFMDNTIVTMDLTASGSDFTGEMMTSNYFGEFSWGRIDLVGRSKQVSYNTEILNGFSGISTSDILTRKDSLRSKRYLV